MSAEKLNAESHSKKCLPYSAGNYSQHLVITYNRKESEKEYMYMYNSYTCFRCCTPETL